MIITFVLGNGFDLNLGFPTDYNHFYRYYVEQPSESEPVKLLKDDIKQYKDKDWVDLEKGLGLFTSKLASVEDFYDAYIDLNYHLSKYMSTVNQLIKTSLSNDLKEKIISDLLTPENILPFDLQNTIKRFDALPQMGNRVPVRKINVLSFNYTLTVEYLNLMKSFSSRSTDSIKYLFGGIRHIHRTVNDKGVWLGVDNINQIKNDLFRKDALIRQLLIKPYDIMSYESGFMEVAKNMIESSNLICIFGSSLGATDLTWWKMIGSHLKSSNCRLVYYTIDKKGFILDHLMLHKQNSKRAEIAELFTDDTNGRTVLDNPDKIVVPINTSVFRDRNYDMEMEKRFNEVKELLNSTTNKV